MTINLSWVSRNVKENLQGVRMGEEKKKEVGRFFLNFYTELESNINALEKAKQTSGEKAKNEVFGLLKSSSPKTEEEFIALQKEIERLTMTFNETDIFAKTPEIISMLVGKDLITAKEYLRGLPLPAEDMELLGELGCYTVEALIVHVLSTLYTPSTTAIRLATLVDQLEKSVKTQARLLRDRRLKVKGCMPSEKIGSSIDQHNLVVADSNILTDRNLYLDKSVIKQINEPFADIEEKVEKPKSKRVKKFPIGTALIELMEERKLIEMKIENLEGAKVMKKDGKYYNQKPIYVTCNFRVEQLPMKINLPMVCQPLDWVPVGQRPPQTLADIKGGYLGGLTANISDRYCLLSSKNVKNFNVILNNNYERLCTVMNTQQRQAFQINKIFLAYIRKNYQEFVNFNMLQPRFLCNVNIKDIAEKLREAFLKDVHINKSVSYSFMLNMLLTNIEKARYERLIIQIAEAYQDYVFYMPAFIDFRGRIYRSGILNFHERDLARSLIIFSDPNYKTGDEADSRLLRAASFHFKSFNTTEKADEWYCHVLMPVIRKIHLLMERKESQEIEMDLDIKIREEFGIEKKEHQDVNDILSYADIAKNAKNPFQFLSNILINLYNSFDNVRYNYAITQDASASAFQINSFFLLNELMAKRTNLIPDENGIILDIYSCMREELISFLKRKLPQSLYNAVIKEFSRKLVKSIFMPKIYGKTYKTTKDDLLKVLGNLILEKECAQVTTACFDFWKEQYYPFECFITLIQNIGWITASADRPVIYEIDYFTTLQDYMSSQTVKVWVFDRLHKKKRQISFKIPSSNRDVWQSNVSTFVNFIHQRDAYIAMHVVEKLLQLGVPIYTVHDNFISTPGYSGLIAKCYSEVFQEMGTPLSIINKFIYMNVILPVYRKRHPFEKTEETKKKRSKPELTNEIKCELLNEWGLILSQIVRFDFEEVIEIGFLEKVLSANIPEKDPATGNALTASKKKSWGDKISATIKAYESYTRLICGDQNYPQDGGQNHIIKYKRFIKKLDKGSNQLTCVHY